MNDEKVARLVAALMLDSYATGDYPRSLFSDAMYGKDIEDYDVEGLSKAEIEQAFSLTETLDIHNMMYWAALLSVQLITQRRIGNG